MSIAELLSVDVKPWSQLNIAGINLNNSGVTGISTSNLLDTYVTDAVNHTSTGTTAGVVLPAQFTRIGNLVNITWQSVNFTSGATGYMRWDLDEGYRPVGNMNQSCLVINSGSTVPGKVQFTSSGGMTFSLDDATAFNGSASCGVLGSGATYYSA